LVDQTPIRLLTNSSMEWYREHYLGSTTVS
jgi:hypothetical protein